MHDATTNKGDKLWKTKYVIINVICLAYAWIQIQEIKSIYSSEEALQNGTLFPELNLPLGVYGIKERSAD